MQKQEAETLTTNNPNDSPQTPELSGTENEAIVTGILEDDGKAGIGLGGTYGRHGRRAKGPS